MLESLGTLIFTLPVALILLIGREWFFSLFQKSVLYSGSAKEKRSLIDIDLWAFGMLSLYGISWGGLLDKKEKANALMLFFSQLWFLSVLVFFSVYFRLKNPDPESYLYFFTRELIGQSWTLFLLNLIPLPPLDASFFYVNRSTLNRLTLIFKFIFTLLVVLKIFNYDFINGRMFLDWIGAGAVAIQ